MGSLGKRLGQLSRRTLETESANILKTAKANKVNGSLSLALDGTLRRGHDMKAFGLGTLASLSSRKRYASFTLAMYSVYSTMEHEIDLTVTTGRSDALLVWQNRSEALYDDLLDIMAKEHIDIALTQLTPATEDYVNGIHEAGNRDRHTGGGSLVGHLYCRYFADLFGGQMLASPYNFALALPPGTPRHYQFRMPVERRVFIEELYKDINIGGECLTPEQQDQTVEEAMSAFRHNIRVYTEEPGLMTNAVKGAMNVFMGFGKSLLVSKPSG